MGRKVFVVGVGMTPFGRLLERSVYDMVDEAVGLALKDAGATTADVGAVYYSTMTNGMLQGQTGIPGPIAMRRIGIEGVPVFSVENACASGSSATCRPWNSRSSPGPRPASSSRGCRTTSAASPAFSATPSRV